MGSTKRDDILEAALSLFADRGFHGTAVPDLAAAASVGTGTIYRHFESKEGVVNELYAHWKARFRDTVFESSDLDGSWRQRFRTLWQALFRFAREHPGALQFLDLHYHGTYLDERCRVLDAQSAAKWIELVVAGQRDEALAEGDPIALISMAYGAFLGLLRAEAAGHIVLDDARIAQAEQRVWRLIRR